MADKLKVYKDDTVVGTAERQADGKAKVTVDGLEANTDYPAGTYKVSFENENGESEKVNVPAFKTKVIPVQGITFSTKSATLKVGETYQLKRKVAPSTATNKSVTYSSSKESVAKVSTSGVVTAVSKGTAIITVKTKDGNKTDTATITVNAATV